jgi:hypothetical protein
MMTYNSTSKTALLDLTESNGTYLWRQNTSSSMPLSKMTLASTNSLTLHPANGLGAGVTLDPNTGSITLSGVNSGIYNATGNPLITFNNSGSVVFPQRPSFAAGLNISSGSLNIASTTPSTSSTTGALTVAGGLGVGQDSYINGVRIGRGGGNHAINTVLGTQALNSNTTGSYNLAFGGEALYLNTVGTANTAIGARSLYFNTTGGSNAAFGVGVLLSNTTGYNNTAVGTHAFSKNVDGFNNSVFGNEAGRENTSGSRNVFFGSRAGMFQADGFTPLSATNSSIYIGANSRGFSTSDRNSIVIGTDGIGEGANTTVLGNIYTTRTRIFGNLVAGSGVGSPVLTETSALSAGFVKPDSAGRFTLNATTSLVVEGSTRLKGQVIIEQAQGDISMGEYN